MVRPLARVLLCLGAIGWASASAEEPAPDPAGAVGSAMGKGSFPWYDAPRDAVRPIPVPAHREWPSRSSESPMSRAPASGWGLGNLIATAGFAVALAVLVGLLAWFWRIYEPSADADAEGDWKARGVPVRVEELPAGLGLGYDASDPWAEAIRRRDRGDLAGAILCLFAHQLLTLSRLGLVRLAPGKTGRQLLRSVADADYRGLVAPTLGLFEAAYYGHRAPSAEEFARAWAGAEAFERRAAAGLAR